MEQRAETPHLMVIVVRSGGIAGLRREWRAEPPADAIDHWIALIDGCPWDTPADATRGADRYRWFIRAQRDGGADREAELGDTDVSGPWRALVDEVRALSPRPVRSAPRPSE
jgi:hypothetical protein